MVTNMRDYKFWVFKEHHGYKYMFEVDDKVMPYVLTFFDNEGQVDWCIEETDDTELKEAWETAKETPTVDNVAKFVQVWEYAGCDDENVSFVHLEQVVTKESIKDA